MSLVNIFLDSSFYQELTSSTEIQLSPDIKNIQIHNLSQNKTQLVILLQKGSFEQGSLVDVNGYPGILIEASDKWVDLEMEDKCVRIWNPSEMISRVNKNIYLLKNEPDNDELLITGHIPNYTWVPTYTLILSEDPDWLKLFSLDAKIIGQIQPKSLWVNKIVLHHKHSRIVDHISRGIIYDETARNSLEISETNEEEVKALNEYNRDTWKKLHLEYDVNYEGFLEQLPLVRLQSFGPLNYPRHYFIEIIPNQNSKALYGYSFVIDNYVPPGNLFVLNHRFSPISKSKVEVVGEKIFIRISSEENLIVSSVVSSTSNEEQTEMTIDFSIKIKSKFDHKVQAYFEMKRWGKVISGKPEINEILPNRLGWFYKLSPGDNLFKGQVKFNV